MARARMCAPRKCHPHCKPGRHVFTHEECVKGFENMQVALATDKPDLVCTYHGGHFAACLLKHKNPLFFVTRTLAHRVDKMEARDGQDAIKLAELKQGLAQLQEQARGATQRPTTRNRRRDSHDRKQKV